MYRKQISRLLSFHTRHKKVVPIGSFIGGFAYDTYTLQRIDLWLDNLQMLGYLLLSASALMVIGMIEQDRLKKEYMVSRKEILFVILHFCLGGLFSAYTIYYFKSASISQSYVFVGLMILIWLMNEFKPKQISQLKILSLLHFFCSFTFITFFLPILTHRMNVWMFLLGGLISLVCTTGIWYVILRKDLFLFDDQGKEALVPPFSLFIILLFLYSMNWIPPVPLSLIDIGIYRGVQRTDDGQYLVRYKQPGLIEFGKKDDRVFEYTEGDTVFCYTAIFAPTDMRQNIIHHWEFQNADKQWQTTDRIAYPMVGGRDGGWRGYSMKRQLQIGYWRINVLTEDNLILGRVQLTLVKTEAKPTQFAVEMK